MIPLALSFSACTIPQPHLDDTGAPATGENDSLDDSSPDGADDTGADSGTDTEGGGDTAAGDPRLQVAPSEVSFGVLFVGTAASEVITVTNVGQGDAEVQLSIVGGHAEDWTLAPYTATLAPGGQSEHTLSLRPTEWGDFSVSVLVTETVTGDVVEVLVQAAVQIDDDGDGHGSIETGGDDCDDGDASAHPGAEETWYSGTDESCDGGNDFDQDGDGFTIDVDCHDEDPAVYPGAPDTWYDGVDSDCDGADDFDQDGDGYAASEWGGSDCDDLDPAINPGVIETWYDGIDSDCDGADDFDQDGDGFTVDVDCDDTEATTYPGAPETWYDGVDSDCDGADDFDQDADGFQVDVDCDDEDATVYPGAPDTWYDSVDSDCDGADDFDQDGDGYAAEAYGGSDCDDLAAAVNPGVEETWYDGVDSDCDGGNDFDRDGDGYTAAEWGGDDCDDTEATTYPGAPDAWYDGVDSNCDGADDFDQDGDGVTVDADCDDTDPTVGAITEETLDGTDEDCDGVIDDVAIASAADGALHGGSASLALAAQGAIAVGGDLDGDGVQEIVVASGELATGFAWVVSADDAIGADADIGDQASIIFYATSDVPLARVAGPAADLTGDGIDDVLLAGYSEVGQDGMAWLVDGSASLSGAYPAATKYQASFEGDSTRDMLQWAVPLDVDGDGVDDVVTGAPLDDGTYTNGGNVAVFLGGALSGAYTLDDADDDIRGSSSSDELGTSVSGADVDGDGYADILAGAPADDDGGRDAGAVYLFQGNSSASWSTYADAASDAKISGAAAGAQLGQDPLCVPGDLDGDAVADVVIGLASSDSAWIFFARSSPSGALSVADADTTLTGTGGTLGKGLGVLDFDGDGLGDLVLGDPRDDTAATDAGAAFLFSGAAGFPAAMTTSDASASLLGTATLDYLGAGVGIAGDLDGDGKDDLAVGAPGDDDGGPASGTVFIVLGR